MRSSRPPLAAGLLPETEPQVDPAAASFHNANSDLQNMSGPGPSERSRVEDLPSRSSAREHEAPSEHAAAPKDTMAGQRTSSDHSNRVNHSTDATTQTVHNDPSPLEMQVHFDEFAVQLRLHRDSEHKRRMLQHRRNGLRKGLALSTRLQRLTSWCHDGLVEIGGRNDAVGFVHVHQHLQDLTDTCFAHWNRDIQALDPVNLGAGRESPPEPEPFLAKLSTEARKDCLEFIHSVRSSPRFLIDRFKAVSPSQLATLNAVPRYQDVSTSVLDSLSQDRGRSSQKKKIHSFSRDLEQYASSFERKNPMSFLLYNCFGANSETESNLRLSTWASVCCGLYTESPPAFESIIKPVLSSFSTMRGWRAKSRLELFLMDVLQRGAFLLEPVGEYRSKAVLQTYISDTLDTDEARDFFDDAVRQLFAILCAEDGGVPHGAMEFGRAMLAKMPDDQQASFRSYFFFTWFLGEFLRLSITFPENEKMLPQFHISEASRVHILHQLWSRARTRALDVFVPDPQQPVDPAIAAYVNGIIAQIYPDESLEEPYSQASQSVRGQNNTSFLTICSTDIVQVLESLSQQYVQMSNVFDPFMISSLSTFNSQYPRANRYDRLRRELLSHLEPGHTTTILHPCQEHWIVLPLGSDGRVEEESLAGRITQPCSEALLHRLGPLNVIQEAAVKLALEQVGDGGTRALRSPLMHSPSNAQNLGDLIFARLRDARSSANNVESFYWQRALETLDAAYAPATWKSNQSRIFKPILVRLSDSVNGDLSVLENEIKGLENCFMLVKELLSATSIRLNRLKIKVWYTVDVINSTAYENAKNISRALNYMALPGHSIPESTHSVISDKERPGTSTSTTSSMFEQPRIDTMTILKASKEHGGPRKLADEQIEMTKRWLDRNNVENFCKGEERIHRFCLEIKMTTKKLVAETLSDSPVLWSSELWVREKTLFDVGQPTPFGMPGSTRPPSVMSESLSSAQFSGRPSIRTMDSGSRSLDADLASSPGRKSSFLSLGSSRLHRELLGSDISASLSPGRSLTVISGESISTMWSPLPSQQSRSVTSASSQSRAPSIFNEFTNLKLTDPTSEKARFLDVLQHELTCLLLSDLGNPVWSCGSETDSWLDIARKNSSITQWLSRRMLLSQMLPLPKVEGEVLKKRKTRPNAKRWSSDDSRMESRSKKDASEEKSAEPLAPPPPPPPPPPPSKESELQDVLDRISHQVDPNLKLEAVYEFKQLALLFLAEKKRVHEEAEAKPVDPTRAPRRQSIGSGAPIATSEKKATGSFLASKGKSEQEIIEDLKETLLSLHPTTLFRDLQYIAAFIPAESLETETRRALVHVGLAALASKDEICRCMVDLAYKIVSKDSIKRMQSQSELYEQPLTRARDYWVLAAREGNAIAQRELAGLYLAHPEVPPVVSLPLSLSQDIFKTDMRWEDRADETSGQPLCLALHWMQAAADNGDEIATQKIRERKETAATSFR